MDAASNLFKIAMQIFMTARSMKIAYDQVAKLREMFANLSKIQGTQGIVTKIGEQIELINQANSSSDSNRNAAEGIVDSLLPLLYKLARGI